MAQDRLYLVEFRCLHLGDSFVHLESLEGPLHDQLVEEDG